MIARVPYDEGTLTGNLTKETVFPAGDWRGTYFVPENLNSSVDRAEGLRTLLPEGMDMAEMALRFILQNKAVGTVIPGIRKLRNAKANTDCSDGTPLKPELHQSLQKHRWDRKPTAWSQ